MCGNCIKCIILRNEDVRIYLDSLVAISLQDQAGCNLNLETFITLAYGDFLNSIGADQIALNVSSYSEIPLDLCILDFIILYKIMVIENTRQAM